MKPDVTVGIAHVAVFAADVAKSTDFYTRVLGLEHLFTQKKEDGSLFYVYLHAGSKTFVEIFPTAEKALKSRAGVAHICLAVRDINAAVAHVKAENWPLTRGEPKLGLDGNWQAWLQDPDGVDIELMQMMPGCLQYEHLKKKTGR